VKKFYFKEEMSFKFAVLVAVLVALSQKSLASDNSDKRNQKSNYFDDYFMNSKYYLLEVNKLPSNSDGKNQSLPKDDVKQTEGEESSKTDLQSAGDHDADVNWVVILLAQNLFKEVDDNVFNPQSLELKESQKIENENPTGACVKCNMENSDNEYKTCRSFQEQRMCAVCREQKPATKFVPGRKICY
jgi:hypothetical protein